MKANFSPSASRMLGRGGERPCRGDAGVEHVEAPRTVGGETAHDVHDQVACRLESEVRGPGVFDEGGIEVVVDRRRHDDVRGGEDAAAEVLGELEVVVEPQVRAMLLGLRAERDHDHGVWREHLLRLVPGQIGEDDPAWRLGMDGARPEHGENEEDRDKRQAAHRRLHSGCGECS